MMDMLNQLKELNRKIELIEKKNQQNGSQQG
jgi:hypothetical protein